MDLKNRGLGTSTVVCLGGDPVVGLDYRAVLEQFDRDPETELVVLLGEIGGRMELDAAPTIGRIHKPVVAYIAGQSAPPAKRMGHAGAIISTQAETAAAKLVSLKDAGAHAVATLMDIGSVAEQTLPA